MSNDLSRYISNVMQLKNGQHLLLRKPKIEDAKEIIEYLNLIGGESDNLLFGNGEFLFSVEQEAEYIKNITNDANTLMILGIINDTIVSCASISCLARKRIAHNSEVVISVKKDYWRNGIGNAVMKELVKVAKEHDTIKTISLGVNANNKNAITMYEKFGFEKVGMHKDYFNINGIYVDELLMDLNIAHEKISTNN